MAVEHSLLTETNPCEEEELYCLTCENAKDDSECRNAGIYKRCGEHSICYKMVREITSTESRISRGCIPKEFCQSFGSENEHCEEPSNGDVLHCTTCSYFEEASEIVTKQWIHCGPIEMGRCICYGDPHCLQFDMPDGLRKDQHLFSWGSCKRTLYKDYCPKNEAGTNEVPTVHIKGTFTRAKPHMYRSFVSAVDIEVYNGGIDYFIFLDQGPTVVALSTFDWNPLNITDSFGSPNFPNLAIVFLADIVEVNLPNNMKVLWDGIKTVEIQTPKNQMGLVCGICGNFDGVLNHMVDDPRYLGNSYDLFMGENTHTQGICPAKAIDPADCGKPAPTLQMFSDSWIVAQTSDSDCMEECGP